MVQQPLISVCIANYNGMEVIDDCIRSVLAQQGGVNVEILIHDDASNDGSPLHIREQYPHVKLIESPENVGFCIANNRMVSAAKGQYLLLLNNDAALHTDALQTLFAEASRLNRPAILSLPQYDARSGRLIDRGCLLDPFFNPVPNLDPELNDVAMVIGACLWIPKDLWDELGGFPEWFGSIAEDMYLCCRARLAGYSVQALAVSGYRHWQGKSFGGNQIIDHRLTTTFHRRALSERNKSFVLVMTYPAPFLQIVLPVHMALLLVEGTLLSVLRLQVAPLTDIYWPVFRALSMRYRTLLEYRSAIMHTRRLPRTEFLAAFSCVPYKLGMLLRHGLPKLH